MSFVEIFWLLLFLFSLAFAVAVVTKRAPVTTDKPSPLNYENAIPLDAEDLAEGGIRSGYAGVLPQLRRYVAEPWQIEERLPDDDGVYAVIANGRESLISCPEIDTAEGWVRATYALFSIVNQQLEQAEVRLYAINGGNDLFGMFLTAQEAEAARLGLPNRSDWPYLPTLDPPHYGAYGA